MTHRDRMLKARQLRVLPGMCVALLLSTGALRAQTGAPIISTGGSSTTPDAVFLDVAKISGGTDICTQIQQAWTALGGKSGVLDARSITGTVTCASDPFSNATEGVLLLGNVLIQTSVPWQIPSHVWVNGLGDPGSFTSQNTVLQAVPGFSNTGNSTICAASALVCLGHGSQAFRAQVSNMAIDCNDVQACGVAAYNGAAQEGSWYQGVTLANAWVAGLEVSLTEFTNNNKQNFFGAVNSGPYHNVSVQYWQQCSYCTTSTVGVLVQNSGTSNLDFGGVVRDFDNFTVSGFNACVGNNDSCLGAGFMVEGASVNITNSHVEYYPTSVQIGAGGYNTNGVEITNMYMSNTNTGTGVLIFAPSSGYSTGDITISGLNYGANGPSLYDEVGGNKLTDPFIAFYAVGHAGGTNSELKPRVISTSPNVTDGAGTGGNPH